MVVVVFVVVAEFVFVDVLLFDVAFLFLFLVGVVIVVVGSFPLLLAFLIELFLDGVGNDVNNGDTCIPNEKMVGMFKNDVDADDVVVIRVVGT